MDHKMVIRADARAIGAITALGAPMRRKSNMSDYRTGNRAGECVSYFKSDKSDATIFKATRTRKPNRRRIVVTESRASLDIALMQNMGTIHNGDM
jgi:hypothetical protein